MGWLLQTLIDGWEINRWCPRVPAPVRERVGILVALGPSLWSTSCRSGFEDSFEGVSTGYLASH